MAGDEFADASRRVVIERDGDEWIVSDEGGEFARATRPVLALRYAADLVYGPGVALATSPTRRPWRPLPDDL